MCLAMSADTAWIIVQWRPEVETPSNAYLQKPVDPYNLRTSYTTSSLFSLNEDVDSSFWPISV